MSFELADVAEFFSDQQRSSKKPLFCYDPDSIKLKEHSFPCIVVAAKSKSGKTVYLKELGSLLGVGTPSKGALMTTAGKIPLQLDSSLHAFVKVRSSRLSYFPRVQSSL